MEANFLIRYLQNECSVTEKLEVEAWLQDNPKNQQILDALRLRQQSLDSVPVQQYAQQAWEQVLQVMAAEDAAKQLTYRRTWWRYGAAAAVTALFIGLGWTYLHKPKPAPAPMLVNIQTGVKEKKQVLLPDGSKIWLQYNSTLAYNATAFGDTDRQVILNGQAFFDVQGQPGKPFRVQAGKSNITVLGTSFSILSRPDLPQEISVATGKINVTAAAVNINLLPQQRLTYDPATRLSLLDSVALNEVTAVKDNRLVFEKDNLEHIAAKIQQWYNVKISIAGNAHNTISFTGSIEDNGLYAVLDGLGFLAGFSYKVQQQEIVLSLTTKQK
ncbi:FecR domain-containing protein [Chitinophaga sp. Hz27]|uniref:FecR domain-containing protein n=1 Tax=Chitinophaga sp. Hz27 TaxID=3347169 RepID=UPI0035D78036